MDSSQSPSCAPVDTRRSLRRSTSEIVGRIRVRCVGASNLGLTEERLFQWGTSAAYAVLQLRDQQDALQSPERRTRQIPRTANPQWREEFWFTLYKQPQALVLHVGVWSHNSWKEADMLGKVELQLDHSFLVDAAQHRQVRELELQAGAARSARSPKKAQPGSIKLEITLEPSRMMGGEMASKHAWTVVHSPQALRVFRVGLLGSAGLLLLVAANSRWLCRGSSFAACDTGEVPGASTCATLAALAAAFTTMVNFAGSAGLLGPTWSGEPLSVFDLAEMDSGEEEADEHAEQEPTLRFQVQSVGMLQWNASVVTSLLPKMGESIIAIRLLTMFAHMSASALSLLALLLAFLEDGRSMFLGEAAYLACGAFCCLTASAITSWRERKLLVEADREKWQQVSSKPPTPKAGRGWAAGGDLRSQAPNNFAKTFAVRAESLTQPLIEAGQLLTEHLEDELARPLRQRLQEQLGVMHNSGTPVPDWVLPIFSAINTASGAALPSAGQGLTPSTVASTGRTLSSPTPGGSGGFASLPLQAPAHTQSATSLHPCGHEGEDDVLVEGDNGEFVERSLHIFDQSPPRSPRLCCRC